MAFLDIAYRGLVTALAVLAGAAAAATFVLIVVDVAMRNTGFEPPQFTLSVVEYLQLYITALGAPWILRVKGHVFVDSFTRFLPKNAKWVQEKAVYAICAALCAAFFYYSLDMTIDALERGDTDERSVSLPAWLLYAPLVPCFFLMGIEFCRFLAGRDSLYGAPGEHPEAI